MAHNYHIHCPECNSHLHSDKPKTTEKIKNDILRERDKTTSLLLTVIFIQLITENIFRLMNLIPFCTGMRTIYFLEIIIIKKNGGNEIDNYRHLYIYYIGLFDIIQNLAWIVIYKNSFFYNLFSLIISLIILIILYWHLLFIYDKLNKNFLFIYFYSTKIGKLICIYIGINYYDENNNNNHDTKNGDQII